MVYTNRILILLLSISLTMVSCSNATSDQEELEKDHDKPATFSLDGTWKTVKDGSTATMEIKGSNFTLYWVSSYGTTGTKVEWRKEGTELIFTELFSTGLNSSTWKSTTPPYVSRFPFTLTDTELTLYYSGTPTVYTKQ